jgi:hypothetical protein
MRFSLFPLFFNVSLLDALYNGYLTWPFFQDPFIMYTLVVFRGVLEILHTHLELFS